MNKAAIKAKAKEVVEATHYPTCLEDEFNHDVDVTEAALTQLWNEAVEAAAQADAYPYEPLHEGVLDSKNRAIRRLRIED